MSGEKKNLNFYGKVCKSHVCLTLHDNLILSTQGAKELLRVTNFQRRKID